MPNLRSLERISARTSRFLTSTAISSLLLSGCGSLAYAQQAASPPQELSAIVVSPTTVATPIDQTASSVTVITGTEMEAQQRRTAADALSTVPGLNIVQTGGTGGLTSVFMRGTNANHTKVLIDGIEVSDPSSANRVFDFGQLLTTDIDRIEVLRGPQSGLYGSDAIGGVISITTKKGEGPPKVTGMLEGGSFGTFNQTAGLSGSQDRFNYAFNVSHYRSDSTPVTPLELLPPGQARINDNYDNKTFSTKFGAELSDQLALNFVGRYTDAKLGFTGDAFPPPNFIGVPAASQSSQAFQQFFGRGEAVWSVFDGRLTNYFGANYTEHVNHNFDPNGFPTNTQNNGDRVKFDYRGVANVAPGQTLVFGADQAKEQLTTDTLHASNSNTGAFAEIQSEFLKRIFITSNVRFDDNDQFGQHTTYRVAPAVIIPGTETKLKASYGTGFKAPTLSQLYVDFPPTFFANPNLKPETSTGYDVGFEQPFANDKLRVGATYFNNDLTNLITFNSNFSSYANIARAKTDGVETFASLAISPTLRLRADYTYTHAIDAATGLELLRRPAHKGSITADWNATQALLLSGTVLFVSGWVDIDREGTIPRLDAPGYTVVNVAANYKVNDNLTAFARVDNLFNEHYQNPTGFLRPGIGAYGGIRVSNY